MPICRTRSSSATTWDAKKPSPLIVDLHGLNITPLQQILFDGTTDFAERFGFIVLAPMGYSVTGGWGGRNGQPVANTQHTTSELSEIDAMSALKLMREKFNIDSDRIFLMGHSLGGWGTYFLGQKYNDIWAGIAPISGAFGIPRARERYKSIPTLIMHGAKDSIVSGEYVAPRRAGAARAAGAPHIYLEFPNLDHEFWIRRGAAHMESVFLFFSLLSKRTNPGFITPEIPPAPAPRGR